MERKTLAVTHSSMHCFMSCRQKYDYRYNRRLLPMERSDALSFGSAVHAGLETWFKTGDKELAIGVVGNVGHMEPDAVVKAQELLRKYIEVYADEPFSVLTVEHTFDVVPRHPKTHRASKRFLYTGKIDGLIEKDGELWILEHKTASNPDDAYFECKGFDDQIAFYALAMEQELGRPVVGALYDVLSKPMLRMSKGESDDEYAARVAASKTGKVKRKECETLDGFRERVAKSITEFNFTRRWIRFGRAQLDAKRAAFWQASKDMADGHIYQNTTACSSGYGPCEFRHLCKACGDLSKCEGLYLERKEEHEELASPQT